MKQSLSKSILTELKRDNYIASSIEKVLEHENDDYAIKIENRTKNKKTEWLNIKGAYLYGLYHDVSDINSDNIDEYTEKEEQLQLDLGLDEGYSLGDDKDSFDVWEEQSKKLGEIVEFIRSYKSADLDKAIKDVEHSQDNIYTADIMITGLKEEDIEKEDELSSSILDRYPFINNIQISNWYDDVVCFIDFDINGVYNKHKSDLVVVIRRVLEAIGR